MFALVPAVDDDVECIGDTFILVTGLVPPKLPFGDANVAPPAGDDGEEYTGELEVELTPTLPG